MKRLRVWKWTDEVYDVLIFLIVGTGQQAKAWLKATFNEDYEGNWTGAKTCFIENKQGCALVLWFPHWWSAKDSHHLGVLAHEAQHGTFMTLTERGCAWTKEGDEAFNYHTAWLFREAHKRLVKR